MYKVAFVFTVNENTNESQTESKKKTNVSSPWIVNKDIDAYMKVCTAQSHSRQQNNDQNTKRASEWN